MEIKNNRELRIGDIVQHFKREQLGDNAGDKYLYLIKDISTHTETGEVSVVYEALYEDEKLGVHYGTYNRPYDMFMSKVDHEKYPYIKQEYRFEKYYGELPDGFYNWHSVDMELPSPHTLVLCHVVNADVVCLDFVNTPFDEAAPFQHYIVDMWRYARREELNDMIRLAIKGKQQEVSIKR